MGSWIRVALSRYWLPVAGALAAFLLGFWYANNHKLEQNFHQRMMAAAVNYACTGHLASLRMDPNAPEAAKAGFRQMTDFLYVQRHDFSCDAFLSATRTTFFDGVDYGNVEAPLYLSLVYGVIWRWFGVHWVATYYVIGLTTALSFLALYLCVSTFLPRLPAVGLALAFLANPLFITHVLNPRDAFKFPFSVAAAALLIGSAASPRRPLRYIAFAAAVGLLIGIGYGFRSDLLFFLVPAAVIIGALGAVELGGLPMTSVRKLLKGALTRASGVCVLLLGFFAGGWMPLVNDNFIRRHAADVGYHVMIMGQLGNTDEALYQENAPNGAMYMFRNDILSDVPAVVRVVEYAARRGSHVSFEQGGPYWTFAKRYYLDVIAIIPADLIARGIGAFVHLMTFPSSFARRPPLVHGFPDPGAPWVRAYQFKSDTSLHDYVLAPLDKLYRAGAALPLSLLFVVNCFVLFEFLCVLKVKFGIRSTISTIVVLGAVLMVISLKFEMRHAFYIYAFLFVAWCSALRLGTSVLRSLLAAGTRLPRIAARCADRLPSRNCDAGVPQIGCVAAAVIAVIVVVIAALYAARAYQVTILRHQIADFVGRKRVPAQFEVTSLGGGAQDGRVTAEGKSRIRILSPVPLSIGGYRTHEDPITDRGEMGVVALELDGGRCHDRVVRVTAFARSEPSPIELGTKAYVLLETFVQRLEQRSTYVALLPMHFYRHPNGNNWLTVFDGIDIDSRNVSCIRSVSLVAEFKPSDVLLDYFVPEDPVLLRRKDLFQKVYIPGLGYL